MSENNEGKLDERLDDALDLLEEKQTSSAKEQRSTKQKTSGQPLFLGGILSIFLSLIAIGIASYGAYTSFELKRIQDSREAEPKQIEQHPVTMQALAGITSSLKAIEEAINLKDNLTQESINNIRESQRLSSIEIKTELDRALSSFKQSRGSSSEDWLLAEAEYLIRLANQRIKMEQDAVGALALLSSADEIIQDAKGVIAYDVRMRLAEDMAKLRTIGDLDTDGIFVKIGALINQVNHLEQKNLQFLPLEMENRIEGTQDIMGGVMRILNNIGARIASLVDYRNDGTVVTPILPPKEDYYLRQNLVMKMQHAQLALLRRNQSIYDSSLNDSLVWIDQYFDPEHGVTLAMSETIQSLRTVRIEEDVPDISASLTEMRKLMDGFDPRDALPPALPTPGIDVGEEK
ncbi:MAG: uroporphyrin-3 C-methyltransferase [Flavobacterium sp.]|jgi:uroporphyrin-3 C-methyltransferase